MRKIFEALLVFLALAYPALPLVLVVACSEDAATKSDPGIPMPTSECVPPSASPRDPSLTIHEPQPQSEALGSLTFDAGSVSLDAGRGGLPHLVVYGNSIVFGAGVQNVLADSFPAHARAELTGKWQTDWIGRGGWAASQLYFASHHDLPPLMNFAPRNVLVFYEGTNDMGNAFACEAFEAITREQVARGWDVIVATVLPTSSTFWDADAGGRDLWIQRRNDLNTCIVTNASNWGAKAVWDIGRDARMQNPFGPNYADGVHPSAPGYVIMGHSLATLIRAIYP